MEIETQNAHYATICIKQVQRSSCRDACTRLYLIEVLQHSLIIGCSAESSSLELNALDILLLRLLQLNASMKTVGSLSERATEASSTLQQNTESYAVNTFCALMQSWCALPTAETGC